MKVVLAPMEGFIDPAMRSLLTQIGGFDYCVSEFVRVTAQSIPNKVFFKMCPELQAGAVTPSNTPVAIQLLGGDPYWMARNAKRVAKLGLQHIDLNFGCPAKCVNSREGGAKLLRTPEKIHQIVKSVRTFIPESIKVTAKMRLGYNDKSLAIDNALAIQEAGADALTIHARTKLEGYKPPAHWHWIGKIRSQTHLNIIANGDIWNVKDYINCRDLSGCEDVMLGRGALCNPFLAAEIKSLEGDINHKHEFNELVHYAAVCDQIHRYWQIIKNEPEKSIIGRLKQWLALLSTQHDSFAELFSQVKRTKHVQEIIENIPQSNRPQHPL